MTSEVLAGSEISKTVFLSVNNRLPFVDTRYALVFIFFQVKFLIFITYLFNFNLEYSFKLSILTIMNTVNSNLHLMNEFNFDALHYITKYFIIIFMIIGRVELLTFLIIIKKFLFKN